MAVTTRDLVRARKFWVEDLGLHVTEEEPEHFFIVDAGGLRLCFDLADGRLHVAGGTDPVIGLKVASLDAVLKELARRGIDPSEGPLRGGRGSYAVLRDPDGRAIVVTEAD